MEFPPLPLQLYQSRWKSLLFLAGCIAFCAGGYFMTQAETGSRRMSADMVQLVGWALLVFAGAGIPIFTYFLVAKPPQIVFTSKGVYQLSPLSLFSDRMTVFLRWNDIAGVSTQKIKGTTLLYVHRRDGKKAITVQPFSIGVKARDFTAMLAHYQRLHGGGAAPS